jgi:hypothetical protein
MDIAVWVKIFVIVTHLEWHCPQASTIGLVELTGGQFDAQNSTKGCGFIS